MKPDHSYQQIIRTKIFDDPAWAAYARGQAPMPAQRRFDEVRAVIFHYLGDRERAAATSSAASRYFQTIAGEHQGKEHERLVFLFKAALYRNLAHDHERAQALWAELVERHRRIAESSLPAYRQGQSWLYESYALLKLGRFAEAAARLQQGDQALAALPARERSLTPLLAALAEYMQAASAPAQRAAQDRLRRYKHEHALNGKQGYAIIFDLQYSFADVLDPVLPGPDPDED